MIAILGEIRKNLLLFWTYKADLVVALLTLGFGFVGIGFFVTGGEMGPEQLASLFLGYLAWYYVMSVVSDISWGLRREIQAGTLEQMAMSPAPTGLLLLGRVLANLITTTLQAMLVGGALFILLNVAIPIHWEALLVLAVTLLGVLGFGFIIAGAMIIFKQFESFTYLIQNGLLFLNGSVVSVDAMPGWLAGFAKTLPSTQGVIVLRRVALEGQSLASAVHDESLTRLIVNSTLYFIIGWLVFVYCERVAKEHGSLGQY